MSEIETPGNVGARERHHRLTNVKYRLQSSLRQIETLHHSVSKVLDEVETALNGSANEASNAVNQHRRAHKPGRASKIDTDTELRKFILARIDDHTYEEIASAVSSAFPPERCVRKSAIQAWWNKQHTRYE